MRKSSSIGSLTVAVEREIKPENYDEVLTVGNNIDDVILVANNLPDINAVNDNLLNINTVNSNIGSIDTVAANISVVLNSLIPIPENDYCPGYTFNYIDGSSFSVVGYDVTKLYYVNRRIKFFDGANTYYGSVLTTVFGTDTVITLAMENGNVLTNTISDACVTTSNTAWVPIVADPFSGSYITKISSGTIGGTKFIVAVGISGKAYSSTDSGNTWTVIVTGTTENLKDVAYNDTNEAFIIVGDSNVILETLDGITWTNYTSAMPAVLGAGSYNISNVIWYPQTEKWYFVTDTSSTTTASYVSDLSDFNNSITFIDLLTGVDITDISLRKESSTNSIVSCYSTVLGGWGSAVDTSLSSNSFMPATVTAVLSDITDFANSDNREFGVDISGAFRWFGGGLNSTKVANTTPIRGMAISPVAVQNRIIVVGDNGYIGAIENADYRNTNPIVSVSSGLDPSATINCIHWSDSEGFFIVGGSTGQIAKSTNGVS